MDSREILEQLTVDEKAELCSGKGFWHMKGIEKFGLPPIMITDGPHGLRKQEGESDHLGLHESVQATCFPAACAMACSFDEDLMRRVGEALGQECLQEGVSVLLGPGVNIKRSPLCGRNFEYYSEDPYLSGIMGGAWVNGLQSQGVGASLKHFAANNQEKWRMTSNSVVDERALREIYLRAFEMIVKKEQPWTVMCSYNLLNGVYASENEWLLCDVLRNEWGFEGLVVSDWGATDNRVAGVRAGMDLEMPYSGGFNDIDVLDAVTTGELDGNDLDHAAQRVVGLMEKSAKGLRKGYTYNVEGHHELAREAAAACCVLLKNEGAVLPMEKEAEIAVIGQFAKTPRYQGAGSSKINPTMTTSAYDALIEENITFDYADGYSLGEKGKVNELLIQKACETAKEKDIVLVFAGLPDEYESEGYDREMLDMPESHNRLIEAVAQVNSNVVVVLQLGAPVLMPWIDSVKAVVAAYLGGQASGGCVDILTGKACPSGKLPETWPLSLKQTPCSRYFPGTSKGVEYRESIYVGYRYYEKADIDVAFPFGFGLSYTTFEYKDIKLSENSFGKGKTVKVSVTVANTGARAGAETLQLYIGKEGSALFRPVKELKGVRKVLLQPGEHAEVVFELDERSFAYYNVSHRCWALEGGTYTVSVGASSADIRLRADVEVRGDGLEKELAYLSREIPEYFKLSGGRFYVDDEEFEILYGKPLIRRRRVGERPFTRNSTINDVKDTRVGKMIYNLVNKHAGKITGQSSAHAQNIMEATMYDVPLRALSLYSQGALSPGQVDGLVDMLNGKFFKGLKDLIRGISKETRQFIKTHLKSRIK